MPSTWRATSVHPRPGSSALQTRAGTRPGQQSWPGTLAPRARSSRPGPCGRSWATPGTSCPTPPGPPCRWASRSRRRPRCRWSLTTSTSWTSRSRWRRRCSTAARASYSARSSCFAYCRCWRRRTGRGRGRGGPRCGGTCAGCLARRTGAPQTGLASRWRRRWAGRCTGFSSSPRCWGLRWTWTWQRPWAKKPSARLTLHSTKLCTRLKFLGKKYFLALKLPLRHF